MIGDVAEPGAAWEATDVIDSSHPLPSMRLLRAGHRGNDWFVWWERGGIAHTWQAAAFRLEPDGRPRALGSANIPIAWRGGAWTPAVDVCALIEGMMAGRYPPFPPPATGAPLL
jgi:hypothetical protein